MGAVRVPWFRVLGMGAISAGGAYAYLWSTRAADGSWPLPTGCVAALTYATLLAPPDAPSSEIRPLDTIGGDGSLAITIQHGPTSSEPLLRGPVEYFGSSGGAVRLTEYVSPSATTIPVDDSTGVTASSLAYCGREAWLVTATGAGTLTVTRGACASIAQPYPLTSVSGVIVGGVSIGATVYSEAPSPIGLWCEYGYSDVGAGAAVTVWRGVVESVDVSSDRVISIGARGLMAELRDRKWITPRGALGLLDYSTSIYRGFPYDSDGATSSVNGSIVASTSETAQKFVVDADQWGYAGDAEWFHCRVTNDEGKWVIVPCEYVELSPATSLLRFRSAVYTLQSAYVLSEIVQVGDATGVMDLRGADMTWHVQQVMTSRIEHLSIEYARVSSGSADTIIDDVVAGFEPVGWAGGLPSAWVDLDGIAYTAGTIAAPANTLDNNSWAHPRTGDRVLLAALETDYLGPLGYALAADGGNVVGVDWVPDTRTVSQTIGTSDARAVAWQWSRRGWEGGRQAVQLVGRAETRLVVSGRADPRSLLRGLVTYTLSAWSDAVITDNGVVTQRQSAITGMYAMVLPVLELLTATGTVSAVGSLVNVERTDLPMPSGGIGTPDCLGLVIQRGRSVVSDVERVRILLIGWVDAVPKRWGPSGKVASGTGTTAVFEAAHYTADDDTAWEAVAYPDEVRVLSADGAHADSGTATGYNAGTHTLTITGLGGAPTAGQIVVLGPYSTAVTANRARWVWLADTDGTIGSADGNPWGQ